MANALMLNTLALLDVLAARGGACGMEHPADPGFDPLPSIWATDVMLGLQERRSFVSRTLDQCACGGPCRKPTTLTGNLQGLAGEGPFCPGVSTAHIHERSVGRTATGGFLSQRLSLYPSGLCEFLAVCFVDSFMLMLADGSGPTGWRRAEAPIPRVSNWSLEPTSTQPQGLAVLNECAARGSRAVVNEARHAFYLHVEDGVFSTASAEAADALMHEAADALEQQGFVVGDRTQASECTKVVGFEVQRSPAMLRLPAAKASLLIRSMLGSRAVSSWTRGMCAPSWASGSGGRCSSERRWLQEIRSSVFASTSTVRRLSGGRQRGASSKRWRGSCCPSTRTLGRALHLTSMPRTHRAQARATMEAGALSGRPFLEPSANSFSARGFAPGATSRSWTGLSEPSTLRLWSLRFLSRSCPNLYF